MTGRLNGLMESGDMDRLSETVWSLPPPSPLDSEAVIRAHVYVAFYSQQYLQVRSCWDLGTPTTYSVLGGLSLLIISGVFVNGKPGFGNISVISQSDIIYIILSDVSLSFSA